MRLLGVKGSCRAHVGIGACARPGAYDLRMYVADIVLPFLGIARVALMAL